MSTYSRGMTLATDEARARARDTQFPMADFEDEEGRLPIERSPEYLRFLETYDYARFMQDGRIGPLAAFARELEEAA